MKKTKSMPSKPLSAVPQPPATIPMEIPVAPDNEAYLPMFIRDLREAVQQAERKKGSGSIIARLPVSGGKLSGMARISSDFDYRIL